MNYKNQEKRRKSDKSMTDKRNFLNIRFVKLICLFVKLFAIDRGLTVADSKTNI